MTFQRLILIFFALIPGAGQLCAEDAQAIIDASAKVYGNAQAYSAQVDSRTLQLVFAPTKAGEAPRYDVLGTQYRRLQLKMRRPNDYWLMAQSIREGMPAESEMRPGPSMGMSGMTGGTMNSWSLLIRTDNMPAKRGFYQGARLVFQDVPSEAFASMAAARMGGATNDDPVLRYFQAKPATSGGTLPLGLIEPDLIGRETRNGHSVFRIMAKTSGGSPVTLWIESDTFLIVRSITQRSSAGPGHRVTAVETYYNHQTLSPVFTMADFSTAASPAYEKLAADQMGFGSVADLIKQGGVAPASEENALAGEGAGKPASPNMPASPSAPTEDLAPTESAAQPSAPVGAQALSQGQMSGIVLIEGDGGTATGFMTKIRDVDFIVTNLHVLDGNKKMKIKTLRGEEIPLLGVFGAVGSDIAILRIGSGQGDLKLAKDVFGSSKIGDKVVVVGNRLGGGVATQTSGSIVGVGPTRIEVNANFEPGNSGSPIVNLDTNEVVGVATYSETRRVDVDERESASASSNSGSTGKVEKRWFGYRLDSVSKWEAIDLAKWNAQSERIGKFRDTSEALHAFIRLDFKKARLHPRLTAILDGFEAKYRGAGGNGITAATEVKDLFRVIRTISDDGMKDLTSGDYYDYFRTSLYWDTSIPAQLEYRKDIIEVLKKYEANSSLYVSRLRGGS